MTAVHERIIALAQPVDVDDLIVVTSRDILSAAVILELCAPQQVLRVVIWYVTMCCACIMCVHHVRMCMLHV